MIFLKFLREEYRSQMSEKKSLQKKCEELEKRCALLEQVMDNLTEAVYVTDRDHRIVYFNASEAKNEGFQPEDVGKSIAEIYAGKKIDFVSPSTDIERVLKTGKPIIEQRTSYYSMAGENRELFYSCYPLYREGKIEGVYTISRHMHPDEAYLNAILAQKKLVESTGSSGSVATQYYLDSIIGSSRAISEALESARKVSQHNMPVMIIGETGTGKEMFAQGIHNAGKSACGDFVAVNCAAVPESLLEGILFGTTKGVFTGASDAKGLFEQAENGSIFLDEVNSMPIPLQIKLLRVLQEKKVRRLGGKREIPINCRIISSSNVNPFNKDLRSASHIRSDLLFRLASAAIFVPPLRERKEDIPELCRHFININMQGKIPCLKNISPLLQEKLSQYDWPGNIRELQNIIAASLLNVVGNEPYLELKHLPVYFNCGLVNASEDGEDTSSSMSLKKAVDDLERKIIVEMLLRYNGNISKVARALEVTRPNIYNKIDKLGIRNLLPNAQK